jgi:hypothetical protein
MPAKMASWLAARGRHVRGLRPLWRYERSRRGSAVKASPKRPRSAPFGHNDALGLRDPPPERRRGRRVEQLRLGAVQLRVCFGDTKAASLAVPPLPAQPLPPRPAWRWRGVAIPSAPAQGARGRQQARRGCPTLRAGAAVNNNGPPAGTGAKQAARRLCGRAELVVQAASAANTSAFWAARSRASSFACVHEPKRWVMA